MKFGVENLGPIKEANVEIGDLTIICGKNNCGKTYLTYSLYSFLARVRRAFIFGAPDKYFETCCKEGKCTIDAKSIWQDLNDNLKPGIKEFIKLDLANCLALDPKQIRSDCSILVEIEKDDFLIFVKKSLGIKIQVTEKCSFLINKQKNSSLLEIVIENTGARLPKKNNLKKMFDASLSFAFNKIFPDTFSLTGERSGISIFADNIADFSRKTDDIFSSSPKLRKQILLSASNDDPQFPLPVIKELAFFRNIKRIQRRTSYLASTYPNILNIADALAGGRYDFDDYLGIQYFPENSSQPLSLVESSSSVKSLVEFNFYLRHCAREDQILMIDEPELNLHPANQRKLARLLAMLINAGIKVFITTHSDYIIREFNTLICLNQDKPHIAKIKKEEGYSDAELLNASQVSAYVAKKSEEGVTFDKAPVSQEDGITISTLDEVIDKMNQVQDAITWGAE